MWAHELTVDQKREYGFVKLSKQELERIGIFKPRKKKVLSTSTCEACEEKSSNVELEKLSTKNQTPGRRFALLCRDCRINNNLGRSVIKGWLQ